jgi:hypothetical protein
MTRRSALLLCLVLIIFLAVPLAFGPSTHKVAATSDLLNWLRLFLTTCAFVGALWAVYLKDSRLRANSDNVLISLSLFVIATFCLAGAVVSMQLANSLPDSLAIESITKGQHSSEAPPQAVGTVTAGARLVFLWLSAYLSLLSFEAFLVALAGLLLFVFLRTYNQLYNLRTNKAIKYFKPIHVIRVALKSHKPYEYKMSPRKVPSSGELWTLLDEGERQALQHNGASFLIKGSINNRVIDSILDWMLGRISDGETANYVVADRHPIEIWERMKQASAGINAFNKNFVFIDAYTPSFGFTDDIYDRNAASLKDEGVACVTAKTFAGLHTATNRAFNVIKANEKEGGRNIRRPMTMVYARTSALRDFESNEQFRVFWRHVIPSERSYGMITLILEDLLSGSEVIDFLSDVVDYVLCATVTDGQARFVREK